jgi:D-alanyl-D-alanine carboxypeptidase
MMPSTSTLNPDLITALENALDVSLTEDIPGAAVALVSPNGNWFGASGIADLANDTPLQPDDRFEIGSITKTFVAVTLLQLVEAGQLSLADPLTQWLPQSITDGIPNADTITIQQILNHTSGIADYTEPLFVLAAANPFIFLEDWQPEQLVELITDSEPVSTPGASWYYSNTNFILAGLVVESVTGNSIASEIRNRILTPLNLTNTFFANEEEVPGGYINGYWDFDQNDTLDDITVTNLSWAGAAGAMISNTTDLATFAAGLFKGALLQPNTLARMLDTIPVSSPNYSAYGLGIGTIESPNRFWWVHRGQTLGFRSNLWYSPAEDITYVELINGRSSENLAGAILPTFRNGIANDGGIIYYNEAINGDISGDPNRPLALELTAGDNILRATSAAGDLEYVTVTVPAGFQLDSIELTSYASEDAIAFAAVQRGSVFTEPPTGTNVGNLLGYSHFGVADLTADILDNLASGEGAIGFTVPLPSGDYTFWLQQTGESSTYTFDFNVSAVEEPPTVNEVTFDFDWTGQIAGFRVEGEFTYDANQTYEDSIVREEDLLDFDISFFDPAGNLLKTYEDNHLTFPEFNFAFDTDTQEILQDGFYLGEDGFNFGEKKPVGDGFSGLSFWSRPEFNAQGQVPPPHVHIDDWADEFGFPLGFSSHEDVAFFTRTTAQLIETGRVGEAYLNQLQDSLDEAGQRIRVTRDDSPPTGDWLDLSGQTGNIQVNILDQATEAFFSNIVGFYRIEDETGTVIDPLTGIAIAPGGAGYTEAALHRSQVDAEGLNFSIRDTETVTATLNGGSFYAPFIVADGTVEQALSGDKEVFFDFAAANPLGLDHVRKEGERYAFEDLRGGGDLDFNDAVFTVRTVVA